jgi:hypothetical protein
MFPRPLLIGSVPAVCRIFENRAFVGIKIQIESLIAWFVKQKLPWPDAGIEIVRPSQHYFGSSNSKRMRNVSFLSRVIAANTLTA